MGNPAAEQLVEEAARALEPLRDAAPVAELAATAIRELTGTWERRPWRLGVAGEGPVERASLLDAGCGARVLAMARPSSAPPLRVRRGPATLFRVLREGGPAEEHAFAPAPRDRVDAAQRELSRREHELAELERGLPVLVRVAPPWWALWLWPVRWLRRWRVRRELAARARALVAIEVAQRTVGELEARAGDEQAQLERFLAGIGAHGAGATELELELAAGPLGEGLELVELAGTAAAAGIDALVVAGDEAVLAPAPGGAVRVGDPDQVIRALPAFLVHARALNLAHRARDRLDAAHATLAAQLDGAEAGFAARLARLEALRVPDPGAERARQLERVRPQIIVHVTAILEHATTHLGTELAQVTAGWAAAVAGAAAGGELKDALATIDAGWPETAPRIAREVSALVAGGLAGSAHDLFPELVAPLRAQGLELAPPPAPELPAIAMLPSLASPTPARWSGAADWVTGLFRSFETRRGELAEKVEQRAAHIRDVTRAEMSDVEPQLHAALAGALGAALAAALDRHAAWLEAELARELDAIEHERAALEPLRAIRDAASRGSRELLDRIAHLEAELPGTAAAAAAARADRA